MAKNKITVLTQMKKLAQKAKQYSLQLAQELTTATMDAVNELNEQKADKPELQTVTLSVDEWTTNTDPATKALGLDFCADITLSTEEKDGLEAILAPKSVRIATESGMGNMVSTYAGGARFYSEKKPEASIEMQVQIIDGLGPVQK